MKTCIHCGAALPDDARFCHKCAGAQGPKRKAGGPFPWRRTVAVLGPVMALVGLFAAFRRPAEALPPVPEETAAPVIEESTLPPTTEAPAPTESQASTADRDPSLLTEVHTKEVGGWDYHGTLTMMGDTLIEGTYTYSNGKTEQVILRLDGTRRAEYQQKGTEYTEYTEFHPNGKWSFHTIGSSDGKGNIVSSFDENGNVTQSQWVSDPVSYIEEHRLKLDDVIEEYTQEILDNWDDSSHSLCKDPDKVIP